MTFKKRDGKRARAKQTKVKKGMFPKGISQKTKRICAKKHGRRRCQEYDRWGFEAMFKNVTKGPTSHINPLVLLSEEEYKRVVANCIELTNPHLIQSNTEQNRQKLCTRKSKWIVRKRLVAMVD